MKFFKMLIAGCFLFGCAGGAKYTWPEKKDNYTSFKVLFAEIDKKEIKHAVIIVCSESVPLCKELEKFWTKEILPVPFFMVDVQIPPDEVQALVVSGISLEVPLCFLMYGDNQGFIGNGFNECTLALESAIRRSLLLAE